MKRDEALGINKTKEGGSCLQHKKEKRKGWEESVATHKRKRGRGEGITLQHTNEKEEGERESLFKKNEKHVTHAEE
jgi:hypothetical protein